MLKTFAAALIATSVVAGSALAAAPAANAGTNPPATASHLHKTAKHMHKSFRKHPRKLARTHQRGNAHKTHVTHIRKSNKAG